MPSSTCSTTPGPSDVPSGSKHAMSDSESSPQDSKKARTNTSAEPSTRRSSNRDTKRRKRRKRKDPVVIPSIKIEHIHGRLDERSRAPLSTRNEIVRFSSAPSEAELLASALPTTNYFSQSSSSKPVDKGRQGTLHTPDNNTGHGMPSTPNEREQTVSTIKQPPFGSLEEKVARLETELKSKNNLITSHQALLSQIQQAVTCQVCLDLMYKPYALAPCGHLACHSCLVNWFTAPPPDNRPAPPAITRRKTCPHCRAVVRERPVEVWGVKGIAQATGKSGLLPNQLPVPVGVSEGLGASADPWKDIFPKPGTVGHGGFPWFFPDVDADDDDDVGAAGVVPRGDDVGMLDMEDGGIYRCLDCMHEIWDGVCSSCGRVYPGHGPEGDEREPMGWFEDQMGAEEVDVADDPGWMGLEEGEADDDGDVDDDWHPFEPWRRRFHVLRRPWGVAGTIHVEGEDDVDEGRVDGSGDEGYESSFIDDGDEQGETDGRRIHQIGEDDEEEDYRSDRHPHIVDLDSDGDEQAGVPGAGAVVSSDEEVEDDVLVRPTRRPRRARRPVEWSDSTM